MRARPCVPVLRGVTILNLIQQPVPALFASLTHPVVLAVKAASVIDVAAHQAQSLAPAPWPNRDAEP